MSVFSDLKCSCMWTKGQNAQKQLHFQKYLCTCGQGLSSAGCLRVCLLLVFYCIQNEFIVESICCCSEHINLQIKAQPYFLQHFFPDASTFCLTFFLLHTKISNILCCMFIFIQHNKAGGGTVSVLLSPSADGAHTCLISSYLNSGVSIACC